MRILSSAVKRKAKQLDVNFTFLFMRVQGDQLAEMTSIIHAGVIKPVIDKVYPFKQTNEAMSYVELRRAKGKVVVKLK